MSVAQQLTYHKKNVVTCSHCVLVKVKSSRGKKNKGTDMGMVLVLENDVKQNPMRSW